MDEVKEVSAEDKALVLYHIKELMADHHLTLDQTFYLLCTIYGVECEITANDAVALFNKGLLQVGNKVNQTLLFHLKAGEQLTLDMNFSTNPKGDEYTLNIADRIETTFVCNEFLTTEYRKKTADRYFKGDTNLARYYLIFRSLFPVKHPTRNAKWNTKFGFLYDGMGLWDTSARVAKKFLEIYRKKDIGIFLEATYNQVRDATDFDNNKTYMTKPYKYLLVYEDVYDDAAATIEERIAKQAKISSIPKSKLNI